MKEFGSDYHFIGTYDSDRAHLTDVYRNAILLADGRQCIVVLLRQYGWKRIWMPDYFCYEVIDTIKIQTRAEVVFYEDNPLHEGQVENLPFKEGDVLLRMNYFGMRDKRSNKGIKCPVIEDHTHDLLGHWALYSDADWCIASLRKSMPIPEGGMLWSPKGHKLQYELEQTEDNEGIASTRWMGMEMKNRYLKNEDVSKEVFRKHYTETEEWFDTAEPVLIDERSAVVVSGHLDINLWQGAKRRNWKLLKSEIKAEDLKILKPEDETCSMFSLVLLFESKERRDSIRRLLIENNIYPAILWGVPEGTSEAARDFADRMLSVHCDGRYSEDDIKQLTEVLNHTINQK